MFDTSPAPIYPYGSRDRVSLSNTRMGNRNQEEKAEGDMTLVIKVPERLKPVVSTLAATFLGGVKPISSVGSSPVSVADTASSSSSSNHRPGSSPLDTSASESGYGNRPNYGSSSSSNRPSGNGYGSSGSDYGSNSETSSGHRPNTGSVYETIGSQGNGYGSTSSSGYKPSSSSSSGYQPLSSSNGYSSSSSSGYNPSSSSSSGSGYRPSSSSNGYGSSGSGGRNPSSSNYQPSSSSSGYQPSSVSSSGKRPYTSSGSSSQGNDRPGLVISSSSISSGNNRPVTGSSPSGSNFDKPSLSGSSGNGGRPGSSVGRRPVGGSIPSSHQIASWTDIHPDICGSEFTTKIIGGHDADPAKWKWMAGLIKGRSGARSFCGGVIIDNRHVVTAAHCLRTVVPRDIMVRIGEYDFSDSVHDGEDYPITNFKIHPYYDRSTQENDIAIITLARSVSFDGDIRPICLPHANRDYAGQISTIVGWGSTAYSGTGSNKLKQVSLPIWSQQDCTGVFKDKVKSSMFCAGMKDGGKDSCQGDSGGPLMVQGPGNRWLLAGVVSWGIKCGTPGYPGVYTKVSDYLDWIHDNIRN